MGEVGQELSKGERRLPGRTAALSQFATEARPRAPSILVEAL